MSELANVALTQERTQKNKRRRKLLIYCAIGLLNIGLLALILTQLLTPASNARSDPLIGHAAPNFSLPILHSGSTGSSLSLSNFKGKPVVLNFWATWCAPCKEELPLLEQTWKQTQAQGKDVVFLGIDFQESNNVALSFLRPFGITYSILLDTSGAVGFSYNITSLPQTIFINRQGVVVSRVPLELTSQSLSTNLQMIA